MTIVFVQGHGQKSEQKHRTKNFAKLPNLVPLLTMVYLRRHLNQMVKVQDSLSSFDELLLGLAPQPFS